jgi:hypothetical protein
VILVHCDASGDARQMREIFIVVSARRVLGGIGGTRNGRRRAGRFGLLPTCS